MKFYPYANQIIKNKSVSAILIKHFYSQDIFAEVLHKNLWGKPLCEKTKTEAFLENRGHTYLDIDKNFSKTRFRTKLWAILYLK